MDDILPLTRIFWTVALTWDEVAFYLDVPNWSTQTSEVEHAWKTFVAERRSHCAWWWLTNPTDKNALDQWELWNTDIDDLRNIFADEPAIAVASDQRAFAQDFSAKPTHHIDYEVGQFRLAPNLLELIGGEESLHINRASGELEALHDQIQAHYLDLIGTKCWHILINALPEDRAFDAIVRHDMVQMSADQIVSAADPKHTHYGVLPIVDEVRIAAGFARWLSFWIETKCSMRSYIPALLNYRL